MERVDDVILFAPGIHTGGGITLLKLLLESDILKTRQATLFLDTRSLPHVDIPPNAVLREIEPTLRGRLKAELRLRDSASERDTVICLHSLPPLFRLRGHTVCFLQNILHLGNFPLRQYPMKTRLRLYLERFLAYFLRSRIDFYIVQTNSMKQLLLQWHRADPCVVVCPFSTKTPTLEAVQKHEHPDFDFVYVADGLPHKNHVNLIQAWILLAEQGIYPKLVLTLTKRDRRLCDLIETMREQYRINVDNRSALSQEGVNALYCSSKALIYPSFAESLGLPLVEASQIGLPILASELDFVRDICRPVETFDPASPLSISRAVRRFLSIDDECQTLYSADTFIRTALQQSDLPSVEETS